MAQGRLLGLALLCIELDLTKTIDSVASKKDRKAPHAVQTSTGELVTAPRNTESKVGDPTYLNCSTNLASREIFWYHGRNYIYVGDAAGILVPYRERFRIERNASDGSHNLVINSVKLEDAGEYICIDDDGLGARRSAQLVVLDNNPVCQSNMNPDGVIGENIFNITPDAVHLTCNVTYHGNIPPEMQWKKVGDNSYMEHNVTSSVASNNRLIYTLHLRANISLDKSSYVCQTTRSTQNRYSCTSEIIKVLYFLNENTTEQNVVRGDDITCTVNNNTFPCLSQWYHGNNSCPLSCAETITTHLLGEYQCMVKCNVRGKEYPSFTVLKAVVVEVTTSAPPSHPGTIAASVLVPVVVVVLIAILTIVYIKRKDARDKERQLKIFKDKEIELTVKVLANDKKIENIQNIMQELDVDEAQIACRLFADNAQNQDQRGEPPDKVDEEEIELPVLYPIMKEADEAKQAISGVAISDGKLFIARKKTPNLEVYACSNPNVVSELLKLPNLVDAVDICSYQKNNFLYIMDKKATRTPKEVMKIDTGGKSLINWKTKDGAGGYLSTTEQGNVIITVKFRGMLLEYSPDGELLRDIELHALNRMIPWHAIKAVNDCYIVSHGTIFDPLHKVCLVDKERNVKKEFGRESGSAKDQLNTPNYLAVTSNNYVLVADLGNNRVLLLDSNLEFKANVVSQNKQAFRCPQRVCADEKYLVVVVTKETIPEEANTSGDGTEEDDPSTEKYALLKKTREEKKGVSDPQRTKEDCILLDIQPLLQKYQFNG